MSNAILKKVIFMLTSKQVTQPRTSHRSVQRTLSVVFALAATALSFGLATERAEASGGYLELGARTLEPSGAAGLCGRYPWACTSASSGIQLNRAAFAEISRINRRINRTVRSVPDRRQYGMADYWSYPGSGAGDCEDFALAKKRELVATGFAANRLLLATVHSSTIGPHAVLVLRTDEGDYVLDNLTDEILPWRATGYAFLRIQNPSEPSVWLTAFNNRS
jgi:predicted transglutaminase-like cysteine proteinase